MWRRTLAAVALLAAPATAAPAGLPAEFLVWAREHRQQYRSQYAWEKAWLNYQANSQVIKALNDDSMNGAVYGHTRFSGLSPAEFREQHLPSVMDPAEGRRGGEEPAIPTGPVPSAVDWRQLGAVTAVKDQSSCGSCWAESAVGNMESLWYLANKASMKEPVQLSVEEVIECDKHDNACYGGYPRGAYAYVLESGGIASDADYGYVANGHTICLANQTFNETCGDGMCGDPPLTNSCDLTCSDKRHKSVAKINSWTALPTSEEQIAAYLAANGPVSVGIDASGGAIGILFPWLQFYKHGIANPRRCTDRIDHGVLIVGYGEEDGQKYWIIKNSWGAKWGESGYFRLARGLGKCGINTMATSSVVKAGATEASSLILL